ncbi:MAG TPA: hypothetical protein VHS06_01300 [Chloroflexota bacterium]|nr:hypothetical protein [Chloroflexota bacterium]HEX2986798.1 hypothetical protein [Chloroflexota bacterium]
MEPWGLGSQQLPIVVRQFVQQQLVIQVELVFGRQEQRRQHQWWRN